eukprot:NODE_40_length_3954_cov_55.335422_g38_i0.p2 GENE.NODE_40_length_3954_cov_55.335422_g38_i0~~NODE_40_length_3954_cov_55.335422_g38_i0.p2  ORF type:complete len:189 (+),score=16.30 NODE_40_length_3954_cov_55.335422_g38_i0:2102-2668(+)
MQALASLWGSAFAPSCTGKYSCKLAEDHESRRYKVVSVVARDSRLSGTIPQSLFTHFLDITMIDLSLNNITGTLPSKIAHSNLRTFLCGGCNLEGPLPEMYTPNLEWLSLHGLFSSDLPEQWGELRSLVTMEISYPMDAYRSNDTNLTINSGPDGPGYIPDSWCNLIATHNDYSKTTRLLDNCVLTHN